MLTPEEIELMREEVLRVLPDTCSLSRAAAADDEYGGYGGAEPAVFATGVPVLVEPQATAFDPNQAGIAITLAQFSLSFPLDTDVQGGDIVQVDGADPVWPAIVLARVLQPESWDTHIRAEGNHYGAS